MRGISFKVFDRDDHILFTILKGIDVRERWWSISQDEIYSKKDESIFQSKNIDGETFLKIISEEKYLMIFANIKAYTNPVYDSYIENYDEFLKSECQIVIICSDVFFYSIYAKDSSIIEIIAKNVKDNEDNFYAIEYITDENDGRKGFSAV